jgi:hypothetical protein
MQVLEEEKLEKVYRKVEDLRHHGLEPNFLNVVLRVILRNTDEVTVHEIRRHATWSDDQTYQVEQLTAVAGRLLGKQLLGGGLLMPCMYLGLVG